MEDSFSVRVGKVFGALSSESSLSSMWSLTDEEIEKKEWNRDTSRHDDVDDVHELKRLSSDADALFSKEKPQAVQEAAPSLSKFSGDLESDLQDLDNQPCASSKNKHPMSPLRHGPSDGDNDEDDELDVRSSIGLDCTLDYEEEEDEYDKVAIGKEKAGDRLYMKDFNDYGIDVNTFHELPNSFTNVARDPRANHLAAKLRLKEDAEAAGDFHSLKLSETLKTTKNSLPIAAGNSPLPNIIRSQDDAADPKPILKKRENQVDTKPQKRVRFDPQFDGATDSTTHYEESRNLALTKTDHPPRPNVPDYMINPSKYTRYTLDSSDNMNKESNRKAYMDFLSFIKKPTTTEMQLDVDSSKPPTFTSRKPPMANRESELKQNRGEVSNEKTLPISIAATDVQDTEVSAMEEDETRPPVDKRVQKSGRHYRAKTNNGFENQAT